MHDSEVLLLPLVKPPYLSEMGGGVSALEVASMRNLPI